MNYLLQIMQSMNINDFDDFGFFISLLVYTETSTGT